MKNRLYNQTIFASSPYGLAITDLDGTFIDVNPVFAKLIGHKVDDIRELSYQDISGNPSQNSFTDLTRDLAIGNKIGPVNDILKHVDGSDIEVIVSATLLEDEGKKLICWFVEESDQTEDTVTSGNTQNSIDYELAISAAQAKSILKTAVDGIVTITDSGCIHSFNPAAENMFGYEAKEVLGKNISILMPEPHRSQHDRYISSYLESGDAKVIGIGRETMGMRKDGSTFDIHLALSETKVDGLLLFTGIIRDISELKKAQQDLKISEERFRRSQRSANIGTWDWNIKTGELYWSERISSLFGYKENELKTTYENFIKAVHPDDRQHVIDSVNCCVYEGDKYDIEHRCVWPDGTVKWMSERGDVYNDSNGEPSHMLGVVQDITLRKNAEHALLESEERFRGAFESATHGMAIVSTDGQWLKVNKSLCDLVGYSEQELLSAKFQFITYFDDLDKYLEGLNSLINNKQKYYQSEQRFIHKNGDIIWILVSTSLVRDLEGNPLHYICQVIDISAHKRAESELKKAKELAENANQAKSEFLSSMSHELRTPLNAIIGFSELLELSENLDNQQLKDIVEIKRASFHLLDLIRDILDLAKIESRQIGLTIAPLNLAEQVQECCNLVEQQAKNKQLSIINKCQLGDKNIIPIIGDKLRTKQVILNLLSNAIKYNREQGSIIISCQHSGEKRVRLSISDTGIGIAAEKVQQLFQPFNRLGAENSNIEGTGIGLVITKKLLEKMGGTIGVYSTEGEGSTFWIEFERAKLEDLSLTQPANIYPSKFSVPSHAINHSEYRILVVEDNPTSKILLGSQLEKLGYPADIAETGEEALNLFSMNQYSAVLTDINLPDIDGVELTKKIKQSDNCRSSQTPVIAITANALFDDKDKYLKAGLDDYLPKPIDLSKLDNLLKKWLTGEDSKNAPPVSPVENSPLEQETSPVDPKILSRYIGDDPDLVNKILNSFMDRSPDIIQKIIKAEKQRDSADIVMEAHKLKSTARTIGAQKLADTCELLENTTNDIDWENIAKSVKQLRSELSDVNTYLSQHKLTIEDHHNGPEIHNLKTLVVDDDPLMVEHTICILKRLGINSICSANCGDKALEIVKSKGIENFDLIFCDLNMPGMNGIEFLRYLSDFNYQGKVILISGVNDSVLESAARLAKANNIHILGTMEKPVSSKLFLQLLNPPQYKIHSR